MSSAAGGAEAVSDRSLGLVGGISGIGFGVHGSLDIFVLTILGVVLSFEFIHDMVVVVVRTSVVALELIFDERSALFVAHAELHEALIGFVDADFAISVLVVLFEHVMKLVGGGAFLVVVVVVVVVVMAVAVGAVVVMVVVVRAGAGAGVHGVHGGRRAGAGAGVHGGVHGGHGAVRAHGAVHGGHGSKGAVRAHGGRVGVHGWHGGVHGWRGGVHGWRGGVHGSSSHLVERDGLSGNGEECNVEEFHFVVWFVYLVIMLVVFVPFIPLGKWIEPIESKKDTYIY